MLNRQSIEQFETHIDGVYAFRIKDELSREDLSGMADVMNDAFDHRDEVDMLISFDTDKGADLTAGLDAGVMKSQFRALSRVRNYCVANASPSAEALVDLFDRVLPVKARTFSSEHNALEHLRAQA